MRVPARTDAPYCPRCGGTVPFHWPRTDGETCPEQVYGRVGSGAESEAPGDASTSPERATPDSTGDDEMNDSPLWEVP